MADSYQVLKGKYEMALSSIRELEQERDIANHKISKMQEERAKQDKRKRKKRGSSVVQVGSSRYDR